MNKINKLSFGPAVGLFAIISAPVLAQDEGAGGTNMTLGVSQRLSYTDDTTTSDGAFIATTGLNFGLSSATKVDTITLKTGSGLAYDSDTGEVTLIDPTLSLAYGQTSKNAGFSGTFGYREVDVSSSTEVTAGTDTFLILDDGTRVDAGGSVSFDFGRTDPISGSVTLSHNRLWYRDTTSADLVDQDTTSVSGALSLRLDDRITTSLTAGVTKRTTEDDVDTTTVSLGGGASLAYTKRLTLDAGVRYSQISQTSSGVTAESSGIGYSFGADYEMPDGAITGSLNSSVDENGRIYNGRIGRQMKLKNGSLGLSFGLSGRDLTELAPLYTFRYKTEVTRGADASLQLSQSFATNDSGRQAVNTTLSASYAQPLTKVSSLGASIQYRSTMVTNFTDEDTSLLDIGVNYTHVLAQDWGLVTGYSHSRTASDTAADSQSNTVFVGLKKDFTWRP